MAEDYLDQELRKWVDLFTDCSNVKSFGFIVGNKIDRKDRTIPLETARSKSEELGMEYWEVSAKTG